MSWKKTCIANVCEESAQNKFQDVLGIHECSQLYCPENCAVIKPHANHQPSNRAAKLSIAQQKAELVYFSENLSHVALVIKYHCRYKSLLRYELET